MNTQKCISDADLARLWEGGVTTEEKQALQQHIEICSDCRARWQQMSAGAQHVETLLFEAVKKARIVGGCLSEDLLAGFINQTIDPGKRSIVEGHLAKCPSCQCALADKFTDAYAKDGNTWWSEYVGRQILGLLAELSDEEINHVLEDLNAAPAPPVQSEAIIRLPILEPVESEARRLAAATGEGFSVQTLRQEDPGFEFELAQFGEQLRITASPLQKDSPYANCLARLKVLEKDVCQWTEVILIDKGEGKCVLEPEQTRRLRPKQAHLTLRLEPIVTLEQLAAAGTQAYMPILKRLLKHEDRKIRSAAIKVAARIYGPEANSLIEPLANDEDEVVRETVKDALSQFPKS